MKKIVIFCTFIFFLYSCGIEREVKTQNSIENRVEENKIEVRSYFKKINQKDTDNIIQLTGEIDGEFEKIEIVWNNGNKTDTYFLKKFNKGDKSWLTNLKNEYGNISDGENNYTINGYVGDKIIDTISHSIKITPSLKNKCEIKITNVKEKYSNSSELDSNDIEFKSKDYIIQSNDFECNSNEYSCNKKECKIVDGYGDFYLDGKLVHIGAGYGYINGEVCGYIQSDYYNDLGEKNKNIRTWLRGSRGCNDLALWTIHKNVRFSINDISTVEEAKIWATKLEKLLDSLKLKDPILDIKGNQFYYDSTTTNKIEKIQLRDFYLSDVCGDDNFGNCTIDKVEKNKIYWSSSTQSQGYGFAKYYETNPVGVTKFIKEENWSPNE